MLPKLLVLTPRFPYPPIGGDRLRIYQLCRHLSQSFRLTLVSMCESSEELRIPIPEDGVFARVERVLQPRWRRGLGLTKALAKGLPFQVGYFYNPAFANIVRALAPRHDAVLGHLIRTGPYLTNLSAPTVLEMTDAISLEYYRALSHANPVSALAYRWEARRVTQYERALLSHCDLTVVVSSVDCDFLTAQQAGHSVIVCGNGVDTEKMPFQPDPDGKTIVFIGKNTAQHNSDAILHFVEDILPLVKQRVPQARFKVVGQISPTLKARLTQNPDVAVTGAVASIPEAAQHASVGVCPIRFGAGIQNKVLEYMALGIPAVTSQIGLEGIGATDGEHLFVAGPPQEWADRICDLLQNPELAHRTAVAARAFIEEHHSWTAQLSSLSSAISGLIDKRLPETIDTSLTSNS